MDTTEYSEGQFVTPAIVTSSPTKIGVVLSEAAPEKTDYGTALCCNVSIDQKIKKWRMNRDSVKNMQQLGLDSRNWVSRQIRFIVVTAGGKEKVIGSPIID
jgi:hypothetical protein